MASITVGFSIPEEDQPRLEHLVKTFAGGNRSAFLRLAMKHMEVVERAERLRNLQTYGVQQRTATGLDDVEVEEIVHRVLSKQKV
jgi:Arc/MetJ-type ribon-helix-helix transcriptional regulator